MNLAAFAVIVARERETGLGDDISSLYGLGADRPLLAWPMTIAMLALAGFPATAGFFGKIYLINAAVDNGYAWLGIVIVHRLRDLARVLPARGRGGLDARAVARRRALRARPAMAGGSPRGRRRGPRGRPRAGRLDARRSSTRTTTTSRSARAARCASPRSSSSPSLCAVATVALGIYPEPLFDVARDAGERPLV